MTNGRYTFLLKNQAFESCLACVRNLLEIFMMHCPHPDLHLLTLTLTVDTFGNDIMTVNETLTCFVRDWPCTSAVKIDVFFAV